MKNLKSRNKYWIPVANDVIKIHADLTRMFENDGDPISPPGIKSIGLLESACGRPMTALGTTEKYPSLVLKLAALTQSIAKNHSFHNGNKRAALATLLTALHRNDLCLKPTVTDDNVFEFVVSITADTFPKKGHGLSRDETVKAIAWWIKNNIESARHMWGSFKLPDFISKCEMAGMSYKYTNGSHVIMNPSGAAKGKHKSIRISGSTRQLNGPAAASYVRKLGLNAQNSGIDSNEFYDGVGIERAAIHRFIAALRRLAKT